MSNTDMEKAASYLFRLQDEVKRSKTKVAPIEKAKASDLLSRIKHALQWVKEWTDWLDQNS